MTKSCHSKPTMKVQDKETGEISDKEVMLEKDEGNRPSTNIEGLSSLSPVFKNGLTMSEGGYITAGNASQLSDGASASVPVSYTHLRAHETR